MNLSEHTIARQSRLRAYRCGYGWRKLNGNRN